MTSLATTAVGWPVDTAPATLAPVTASLPPAHTLTTAPAAALAAKPRATASLDKRLSWEREHSIRLTLADSTIVVATTFGVALLQLLSRFTLDVAATDVWGFARIPLATALVWLVALAGLRTRDRRATARASTEYLRVIHASAVAFGVVAIAFVLFEWHGLRAQLLIALPLGLAALLLMRWMLRRWVQAQRREGRFLARAVVVGREFDVTAVIARLQEDDQLGYDVVGTTSDATSAELVVGGHAIANLGVVERTAQVARDLGADTVILASNNDDPDFVRRLAWQLEGTAADLILSHRLSDVAKDRVWLGHTQGLSLLHVRIPTFTGPRHFYKRLLDVVVATVALLPIALIAPVLALLIKLDSPGTVFFRQRRVGEDGREFEMIKFRTMRATAEQELVGLTDSNNGAGPLFKLHNDPRVTRVGAILRKYSLDELPQFWNVLRGDMSVVGPRPPLPREVVSYDAPAYRRLYLRPGITGPWQVSGRSDLSWEQSIRLDLDYVENWSVGRDLSIMLRTAMVMIRPNGAY
ncbi:sugar transferase [Microbacterium sp. RD1]|uniref:sugar transferase n=1 Tax=Microbacterium sp. RD1 TaxID=3457313 RepID=UPI003FA5663B